MRIFSKKALVLEYAGTSFRTEPMSFCDMPDRFRNSLMFAWALRDGDIEIIGGTAARKRLENEPGKPSAKRRKPEAEDA